MASVTCATTKVGAFDRPDPTNLWLMLHPIVQSRITNRYPPMRWHAIRRRLRLKVHAGREASSITTTLSAASVTNAVPASRVGIGIICDSFHQGDLASTIE